MVDQGQDRHGDTTPFPATSGNGSPRETALRGPGGRLRRYGRNALVVAAATAVLGALAELVVTETWDKLFSSPGPCADGACDGISPRGSVCGKDAKTFHPRANNPAELDIRYSAKCGVVWGRILYGEPHDEVSVHVAGGSTRRAEIAYDHDKFTATAAVGKSFAVKVCTTPDPETQSKRERKAYCLHATEVSAWAVPTR